MKGTVEQVHFATSMAYSVLLEEEVEKHMRKQFNDLMSAWASDAVRRGFLYTAYLRTEGLMGDLREYTNGSYRASTLEQQMFPGRGANILYDMGCPVTDKFDIDYAYRLANKYTTAHKAIIMAQI
jgi:hypothetical protein